MLHKKCNLWKTDLISHALAIKIFMHVRGALHPLEATKVCIHSSPCRLTCTQHACYMNVMWTCTVLPGFEMFCLGKWTHAIHVMHLPRSQAPSSFPSLPVRYSSYWKRQKAGRGLGMRLLCTCCLHVHATCTCCSTCMAHVTCVVACCYNYMYIQEHIRTGDLSKSMPLR